MVVNNHAISASLGGWWELAHSTERVKKKIKDIFLIVNILYSMQIRKFNWKLQEEYPNNNDDQLTTQLPG